MKSWTAAHVALLWIGGLLAFLYGGHVLEWLFRRYQYSPAQIEEIYFWRTIGIGVLGFLLLVVTWRWLSVREG